MRPLFPDERRIEVRAVEGTSMRPQLPSGSSEDEVREELEMLAEAHRRLVNFISL